MLKNRSSKINDVFLHVVFFASFIFLVGILFGIIR